MQKPYTRKKYKVLFFLIIETLAKMCQAWKLAEALSISLKGVQVFKSADFKINTIN